MNAVHDEATVRLQRRDLRGSRLRFLMLTSMPKEQVSATLTQLASPWASVDPLDDHWMPRGLLEPKEAKLGDCPQFLPANLRTKLTEWWLKVPTGVNTPNWNLVSTCKINGDSGLILIEGKAHAGELDQAGKRNQGNPDNDSQIRGAIEEADPGLNAITPGWHLCADSHYQLCNRFAWTWKLASLGIPTVLIFLAFLGATEMMNRGKLFASAEEWHTLVRKHASGVVPDEAAWGCRLQASGAPFWALIRSLDLRWVTGG
jgi:hypothetical protein